MKKLNQSVEAKEKFTNLLLQGNVLKTDAMVSKKQITELLEVEERQARKLLSEISMYYPLIASSKERGYRLAKPLKNLSKEEMMTELKEIDKVLGELKSRVNILNARMKPLIAYKEVANELLGNNNG